MRVLVVDDDLGSRLTAEAMVAGLGHECFAAQDGDEAWRLFTEFLPDVVVTDRSMPGLDGLELCRRIRGHHHEGYTFIVLVTGRDAPADVLEGMRAGADTYLTKPLHPAGLEAGLLAARRLTALHAELAQVRADLARQASTDPLTGLLNRLTLDQDLQLVHQTCER